MLPAGEIKAVCAASGLSVAQVERDYVIGWLLWGIYQHPVLRENLILKGGNCLRKIYFPHTRYSEDLDFTAHHLDAAEMFAAHFEAVCAAVTQASGIAFHCEQMFVKEKQTPDEECRAVDARVYFRGGSGRGSVTMRIKFDISEYERIALPLQWHCLVHPFSDALACQVKVLTYSLEEVLAEKLRSWIQRTRPRDLFDVAMILQSGAVPISKANILTAFLQKTIFKHVPLAGRDEMLAPEKFSRVVQSWLAGIGPAGQQIEPQAAIDQFTQFIQALFDPILLQAVGAPDQPDYDYHVRPHIRETIIEAGRAARLLRLTYSGRSRDIEPYSFRYKVTRNGIGGEYFYGFDLSQGHTIKSFFLHKIEGVSILPQPFQPRWEIEF